MPTREWLHRPAWELGRTLAGYEVHKVLAAVDCLRNAKPSKTGKIGVVGWGEGGRLALYAAALDERIDGVVVSGYFGWRGRVWDEPADRTVFGLLRGHSDREIAALIAPRPLIVEWGSFPEYGFRLDAQGVPERLNRGAGKRGKPGRLHEPGAEEVRAEFQGLSAIAGDFVLRESATPLSDSTWQTLLRRLGIEGIGEGATPFQWPVAKAPGAIPARVAARHAEQVAQIDRHNQWALIDSQRVRGELFRGMDTGSLEQFEESLRPLRDKFREEVIGEFASLRSLPAPNPRTRAYQEGPRTVSYEVLLDVHEHFGAYGILTLPKDLKRDGPERRPVVVCQHGLEGRPQDTVGEPGFHYYQAFATRSGGAGIHHLRAAESFISGTTASAFCNSRRTRWAARCSRSWCPQHRQITEWLASLPFVDAGADRVLRSELRRKIRDADSAPGGSLLPLDLLGGLQRMDLEERRHRSEVAAL